MSILFNLVRQKNPLKKGEEIIRVQPQVRGEVTIDRLAKRIAAGTTFAAAECKALLELLGEAVADELARGNIVNLGAFGKMRPTFTAKSVEKEEDFNIATHLKSVKAIFSPGKAIREALKEAKFERTTATPRTGKNGSSSGK